jgi:hypothetical protein
MAGGTEKKEDGNLNKKIYALLIECATDRLQQVRQN